MRILAVAVTVAVVVALGLTGVDAKSFETYVLVG
jgi:hypothetical protein